MFSRSLIFLTPGTQGVPYFCDKFPHFPNHRLSVLPLLLLLLLRRGVSLLLLLLLRRGVSLLLVVLSLLLVMFVAREATSFGRMPLLLWATLISPRRGSRTET